MPHTPPPELSTGRAVSLYVGALFGPSLLLLPGLAAALAGPASILAWAGLLAVSGLLARVFTAFGTRVRAGGGVIAYTAAGLGERAGRAVGWCFLAGVMLGAPVVCLIGGTYIADALGAGHLTAVLSAAGLLVAVVALTLGGARVGTAVQIGLVTLLVALVAMAVAGAAPAARAANWTPFAPHGWAALGAAASALMLSFVGWEAVAPLTGRLRSPARQLPRVIAAAFAVTAAVYLGLSAATIAVLGTRAGTAVPLAALLDIALGPAGRIIAATAAVALTLAATNAYLTGAAEMFANLRGPAGPARDTRAGSTPPDGEPADEPRPTRSTGHSTDRAASLVRALRPVRPTRRATDPGTVADRAAPARMACPAEPDYAPGRAGLAHPSRRTSLGRAPSPQAGVAVAGVMLLAGDAAGVLGTARLVLLPTTLFLVVYLGCMVSGVRVLRGPVRAAAAVSAVAVVTVLAFCGWAVVPAALIAAIAYAVRPGDQVRGPVHGAGPACAAAVSPGPARPVAAGRSGPGRGRAGSHG